jgi:Leucine-rich repeat (LRR) protein
MLGMRRIGRPTQGSKLFPDPTVGALLSYIVGLTEMRNDFHQVDTSIPRCKPVCIAPTRAASKSSFRTIESIILILQALLISVLFCGGAWAQGSEVLDDLYHGPQHHKIVDLSYKGLTAIPAWVLKDPKIELLVLRNNDITSLPPEIVNMKGLQALDLEENPIKTIPDDLSSLAALEYLNLSYSEFDELPKGVYTLPNLKELWLFLSKIKSISRNIDKLSHLTFLQLGQSNVSNFEDNHVNLPNLTSLYIYGTPLTVLPDFDGMPNLEVLSISSGLWGNSDVQIKEIPHSIGSLKHLTYLDLAHDTLTSIPDEIGQLSALETLKLSMSNLKNLPETISKIKTIKELTISNTDLSSLPRNFTISPLAEEVSITDNRELRTLPDEIFPSGAKLQSIRLEDNALVSLPESIKQLRYLSDFNVSNNKLSNLDRLAELPQLSSVGVAGNNLQDIPCSLLLQKSLKSLDVSNNPLNDVPPCISKSHSLSFLDASSTKLSSINILDITSSGIQAMYLNGTSVPEDQKLALISVGIRIEPEPTPPAGGSVDTRPNVHNFYTRWSLDRKREQDITNAAAAEALLTVIGDILRGHPGLDVSLDDYKALENANFGTSIKVREQSRRQFIEFIASKIEIEQHQK